MDLLDLSAQSKYNDGYTFLLVVTDVLSKFGWLILLKSKAGKQATEGLSELFSSTKRRLLML